MKQFIFSLLLFSVSQVLGQGSVVLVDKPFKADRMADTSVAGPLERQAGYKSLPSKGKEVVYWINLLRKDPPAFHDHYLKPFLIQFPEANSSETKSLIKDLTSVTTLPQFGISPKLMPAAQDHANFMAQKGSLSHTGRGGKSFQKRMEDAAVENCAGENLFDGQDDALMGLILLLIDKGVPGAGHRQALLNPQFREIGIGISYMDKTRMVVVQQFSCKQ